MTLGTQLLSDILHLFSDMEVVDSVYTWSRQPQNQLIICVFLVVMTWLGMKVFKRSQKLYVLRNIRDPMKAHRWQNSRFLDKPTYCNSCLQLSLTGSCCEVCGLCICMQSCCLKMASNGQSCKPLSMTRCVKMPHFWVKGNLPLCSVCFKCFNPCGNLPRLADYRCVWCHKTAHEDCVEDLDSSSTHCSLGTHQTLVIPPNRVSLKLEGWRGRRKLVVQQIIPPAIDNWRPLVVMANPKSGGKDGQTVLSTFRKLLNPIQVIDLSETTPENGLAICRLLPQHNCRILVCGGDGTVGWVLGAIEKSHLPTSPYVAILPLGTGNDLARVLGWGKGWENEDISEILSDVEHSQLSMLDRWEVKIEHRRYLGLKRGAKMLAMNNYLGVGCDAGVALKFHRHRESRPELFQSRFFNKAWYLGFGARDVLEQSCKNLPSKIELYLDGVLQKLPELEGVVLLNINSWSAGCSVWKTRPSSSEHFGPSRMDDKQLEVIGLYSFLHVGKIQVSLAEALKIGQAREIKIVVNESVPVQVDGEPWQQRPATITVVHQGQAHMLKKV